MFNVKSLRRASTSPENITNISSMDENGMDIFRPYSNSIRSGRVFIRPYPIPIIQYP